jgi:hypothetical protein
VPLSESGESRPLGSGTFAFSLRKVVDAAHIVTTVRGGAGQTAAARATEGLRIMNEAVEFDVDYAEHRNRVTVLFRLILVIPHAIVVGLWGYFVGLLTFVQWFIVLFTGSRNESIWGMQNQWLGYATRVNSYASFLHDVFPPFGTEVGTVPVTYEFPYAAEANRLSNFFRIIWLIPAMIMTMIYAIGASVLGLIAWFAILFTGKMPRGMFDFIVKAHRINVRLQSYSNLMTDQYPNAAA